MITRISRLTGWRRLGLSFLLGAVSALALPPFYAMPLLWIVYPILLWQLNAATSHRQAFRIGWAFGFGQFAFAFYWLTYPMFTDIGHWWWAVPFASTILPILLGFIPGFACMMWWTMRGRGITAIIGFVAWLMLGEWIRGHFLTGFPWNLTAHGWIGWIGMLQSYSFLGAYGLGFLTIVAAAMPALLADGKWPRQRTVAACAVAIAILAGLSLWGSHRIATAAVGPSGPTVRLIQPNIVQGQKWSKDLARDHFETLLKLSDLRQLPDIPQSRPLPLPTVFLWPETSVPYPLDISPEVPKAIASVLLPGGYVLAGTIRREEIDGGWRYYNSLEVIDSAGNRLAHYDKSHLAPFGEYMPFRKILPLDALAVGSEDIMPGTGPATITVPGLPSFSTMICYEAVFPELAVNPASRPVWLVQITNDAWFGNSTGPRQHFAMARARAVEQGLPLLRAANTGISGAIDAYGRVMAYQPLGTKGFLDVAIPPGLAEQPFYSRHGDLIFFVLEILAFGNILLFAKKI